MSIPVAAPAPLRILPALLVLAAAVAQGGGTAGAGGGEPVDAEAVAFFRKAGLEQSQVMDHLSWMCDVYGPRLTGSPNLHNAQRWAAQTLATWGLVNAKVEKWGEFGRGWRCEHVAVEVVGDNPWPVIAYAKAWSPSLPGRVEAEVVLASAADAKGLEGLDLGGKIVFVEEPRAVAEPFDGVSKRFGAEDLLAKANQAAQARPRDRRAAAGAPDFRAAMQRRAALMLALAEKRPLAIVDRGNKGDYGTVFVQQAAALPKADAAPGERTRPWDAGADVIPQFTFAVEHYDRICRILQKGRRVRLALELQTSYFDNDRDESNVTAEIPGTDARVKDQLVMLGGHFDSWHAGTGATDNGCGSAVAMEAVRLIAEYAKSSGKGPRRTIRIGLWSGEEEGLLGSRGYVRAHFGERGAPTQEHALLSGYFNLDNGTGKVRGVYLQGNAAVEPIFRAWLRPFHDLGAATLTLDDTGGTDHLSFDAVGLPGFQFIQDPISYDTRTHHSNMDVVDHAVAEDLQQAATIMASFVWHAAQRDEMLPRKAAPAAVPAGASLRR